MCEIKFHCPKCNQKIEAIEDWAGASSSCPKCGAELIIPSKSDEETIVETMQNTSRAYNPLKPTPTKDKHEINLNDEVLDETKFLLDYLEHSRKWTCIAVIVLTIFFCIGSISLSIQDEEEARIVGIFMTCVIIFLGVMAHKMVSMFYRLKRVHWLLMQGIYKNTKKA